MSSEDFTVGSLFGDFSTLPEHLLRHVNNLVSVDTKKLGIFPSEIPMSLVPNLRPLRDKW